MEKNLLIETPYGRKNWSYIKEFFDRDTARPKVVIEVLGGVAECTSAPDFVEVEIIDHDNENAG